MTNKETKSVEELANTKDSEGKNVYFGDTFWAYMMRPSSVPPTLVTVVEDNLPENRECGRNFDVEDAQGTRLWNAYMVIASCSERGEIPHNWDGGKAWFEYAKHRALCEKQTKPGSLITPKGE